MILLSIKESPTYLSKFSSDHFVARMQLSGTPRCYTEVFQEMFNLSLRFVSWEEYV
jgi:hypothetical protein